MSKIANFTCPHCRSTNVVRDAHALWDQSSQSWEISATYDTFDCNECGVTGIEPITVTARTVDPASPTYAVIYDTAHTATQDGENYYGYFSSIDEAKRLFAGIDSPRIRCASIVQIVEHIKEGESDMIPDERDFDHERAMDGLPQRK